MYSSVGRKAAAASTSSTSSISSDGQAQAMEQQHTAANGSSASSSSESRDAAVSFAANRDTLIASIDATNSLVDSLSSFNDAKWTMHYPCSKLGFAGSASSSSSSGETVQKGKGLLRGEPRRAASMFGEDPSSTTIGTSSAPVTPARPTHQRAFSTMNPTSTRLDSVDPEVAHQAMPSSHPLAIDLRLGAPGQTAATRLMESMSHETIAQILSKRFDNAISQLTSLSARVKDNQSRILVTGDVNAGKSTFVNALLRRDILPTDQQPLTTVFCEVLDAQAYNNGKEEVHAILQKDLQTYDRTKSDSFERFSLAELETIATDEEQKFGMVKVYLEDARAPISSTPMSVVEHVVPAEVEAETNKSFIRNGIVSISLIDGPGLNIDSLKTTAVFARQSEIDVVVFVATATEYLTESGKNFLFTAGMEKAYIFIVVNKFETLRNKEKARRNILEQIRKVSPKTYENREELVHFVEAANVLDEVRKLNEGEAAAHPTMAVEAQDPAFAHLEESLRSFLLLKRSISKLTPAKHYLVNLLSDLSTVAEANIVAAGQEFDDAEERLALVKPIHEKLEKERELVEDAVGREEEDAVSAVRRAAGEKLKAAVEAVGGAGVKDLAGEYPGLLGLWEWATAVKASLVQYLEDEVYAAEEEAKTLTTQGVHTVTKDLAERFVPKADPKIQSSAAGAASALPQRVFNADAMFKKRREAAQKKRRVQSQSQSQSNNSSTSSPSTPGDVEITSLDFVDFDRLLSLGTLAWKKQPSWPGLSSGKADSKALVEAGSAVSVVSLGLGAVTMFGTRVVGVKSVIEAVTSLFEVLGSKAARKWAGPIAGVLTLALGAYIIHDLPRAIPHNVGKKLHAQLVSSEFSSFEADRIASETRHVMRLAGYDLRERFRAALEASEKDRKEVEGRMDKADRAMEFLDSYLDKVESEKSRVVEIEL